MNAAKISDARIEAACDYMYDVYSDDERERMRGVLEAADEAEAPLVEQLAEALRHLLNDGTTTWQLFAIDSLAAFDARAGLRCNVCGVEVVGLTGDPIGAIAGWEFTSDTGWLCPKHATASAEG